MQTENDKRKLGNEENNDREMDRKNYVRVLISETHKGATNPFGKTCPMTVWNKNANACRYPIVI